MPGLLADARVASLGDSGDHLASFSSYSIIDCGINRISVGAFVDKLTRLFLKTTSGNFCLHTKIAVNSVCRSGGVMFKPTLGETCRLRDAKKFPHVVMSGSILRLTNLSCMGRRSNAFFMSPFRCTLLGRITGEDSALALLSHTRNVVCGGVYSLRTPINTVGETGSPSPLRGLG